MASDTLHTTADASKLIGDITPAGVKRAAAKGAIRIAERTVSGIALFTRSEVERFKTERTLRKVGNGPDPIRWTV